MTARVSAPEAMLNRGITLFRKSPIALRLSVNE